MEEEIVQDGVTYIREDLMEAVIRQYRIERDEALEHICTKNERAFLNEIREKLSVETVPFTMGKEICIQTGNTRIHQSDFDKTNLSELVEKKG